MMLPDWLSVSFAASWLSIGVLFCILIGVLMYSTVLYCGACLLAVGVLCCLLIGYWWTILPPYRWLMYSTMLFIGCWWTSGPLIGYWSSLLPPDWLLVFFAASWLAIGILCCPLIGYWSQVAEHINEMQRIHEEYGAIFDHLFRQHHKSSKQVSWYLV